MLPLGGSDHCEGALFERGEGVGLEFLKGCVLQGGLCRAVACCGVRVLAAKSGEASAPFVLVAEAETQA